MDVLRTCYSHKVFWDDAKTRSSTIIWYRASDNAEWFPYPHVFSSERYDTVHWFCPGAGEDELSPPSYFNGVPPARFTGQQFCGEPDWFLGAPSDAPGLDLDAAGWPLCCHVEGGYYGSGEQPSSPSSPPSGPTCPGCEGGIAPAVFKVVIHMSDPHQFCAVFNGTWEVPATAQECNWRLDFVVSGVGHSIEIRLLPGFQGCLLDGITQFLPPALPMDCFALQHWTPDLSSSVCTSAFNTMTSQPG